MPRFYFDFSNGGHVIDDEGLEFPNVHAARNEAIRTLPGIAREQMIPGHCQIVSVVMRDEVGRPLFKASLTLSAEWLVETA